MMWYENMGSVVNVMFLIFVPLLSFFFSFFPFFLTLYFASMRGRVFVQSVIYAKLVDAELVPFKIVSFFSFVFFFLFSYAGFTERGFWVAMNIKDGGCLLVTCRPLD